MTHSSGFDLVPRDEMIIFERHCCLNNIKNTVQTMIYLYRSYKMAFLKPKPAIAKLLIDNS